jgi:hypothetical protein
LPFNFLFSLDALANDSFTTGMFPISMATDGIVMQDFVIKELTGLAYTVDSCAAVCFLHNPSCSFFVNSATTCFLGNLNDSTGYTTTLGGLTAYLNHSK